MYPGIYLYIFKMHHQATLTHQSFQFFSTQTAGYSYRAVVRELVPQLCYLDNLSLEESERHSSSTMGEDWVVLQTAIKDSKFSKAAAEGGLCFTHVLGSFHVDLVTTLIFVSADETMEISCPGSRVLSAGHLFSPSFVWPHHSADSRPTTGSRPRSAIRPGPLPPTGPKPGSAVLRHKIVAETCILAHG